jgi:putative transposase
LEVDARLDDKRVHRLYAEEGLSIRTKLPRRKRAWRYRQGRPGAAAVNEIWAMDFMSDQLFDGRPIRILTIVDIHTREGLSTYPRANFRAAQVVEILDGLVRLRGNPAQTSRCATVRSSPGGCSTTGPI